MDPKRLQHTQVAEEQEKGRPRLWHVFDLSTLSSFQNAKRLVGDMIEVFKTLLSINGKNVFPSIPCALHSPQIPEVTIKNYLAFLKQNLRQQYFTVRVIETRNSLPQEIVIANTVNAYKNAGRLDKYWANEELQ